MDESREGDSPIMVIEETPLEILHMMGFSPGR